MNRKTLFIAAAFGLAAVAHTQVVTAIGPFTGDASDSFETQTRGQFLPTYPVFTGANHVDAVGGNALHITGGWSFFGVTSPHSGQVFMGRSELPANMDRYGPKNCGPCKTMHRRKWTVEGEADELSFTQNHALAEIRELTSTESLENRGLRQRWEARCPAKGVSGISESS